MKRLTILPLLSACLAGCITSPPVITDKAPCSGLIPSQLKDAVPGASLPQLPEKPDADRNTEAYTAWVEQITDRWRVFGIAQTAAKRQEFEEKQAIIEGQERCEKRDAEAIKRAEPKFLGLI